MSLSPLQQWFQNYAGSGSSRFFTEMKSGKSFPRFQVMCYNNNNNNNNNNVFIYLFNKMSESLHFPPQ